MRVLKSIFYEARGLFVKGVWLVFAVGAVQVFLLAGAAHAAGGSFSDDFLTLDGSRWTKGDHNLGRSYLNPANVDVVDGNARFKIPALTLQGAELQSNELYHYGTYSSRMKLPHAPSSITGFFLYRAPDHEREIDIEVFNDSTGRVMFTTYSAGRQTHTATKQLPFDPTAGYHTHAFRYDAGLPGSWSTARSCRPGRPAYPRDRCTSTRTSSSRPGWAGRSRSWTPTCT